MPKRAILPVLVATLLAPARPGGAEESLAIDHRPVKCIVAGKYPRLTACFAPSSRLVHISMSPPVPHGCGPGAVGAMTRQVPSASM